MVREILKIYTDNGLGDNNPTFKDIELTEYNAKFPRMGMPSVSATLKWPTPLDDEWTRKEYVVLRGERFYIRHTPSGKKDNQDSRYNHEIEFTSEFAEVLGNTYFEDSVPVDKHNTTYDKPCSNNSTFAFYGTIAELVDRLNCSFLKAKIGDSKLNTKTNLTTLDDVAGDGYCVMLDPYGAGSQYDPDKTYEFAWEDKTLWEAITEGYNITEIPFERHGRKIIFGALPKVVDHKFEYGHDNELLSVSRKNANVKVVNRITMFGSTDNIPYYYPNETEYGHITVVAMAGNNKLAASDVIVNRQNRMLSEIREGQYIRLWKEHTSGTEVDVDNTKFYTRFRNIENFALTQPDEVVTYSYAQNPNAENIWYIKTTFTMLSSGEAKFMGLYGAIWSNNQGKAVMGDLRPSVGIEAFRRVGSELGLLNQVRHIPGGTYDLGHLTAGDYEITFAIGFRRYHPEDMFFAVRSVDIVRVPADYYWEVGGKRFDSLEKLGLSLKIGITDELIGDGFGWQASGRMPFQTNLVPPKYRNTTGSERFYNALNAPYTEAYALAHQDAYKDPDTNQPYNFLNPYIGGSPCEHIHKNEEIKPTIEGVTNNVVKGYDDNNQPIYQLFGEIADIAYDADDNDLLKTDSTGDNDKNDTLKYEHSFFYIKLNIFNGDYGFDLFEHHSQTDAMTIQMRDGSCNGCKFKIQSVKMTTAKGFEVYRNPVVVRDGVATGVISKENVDWSDIDPTQQNTQTHSIWICVQKDASTFGVIMPNQSENFKPKIGDKFNIINIDLPEEYILAAEKRLEEDGMRFMADNNEEKFTFDIQASRIFLADNPDVLAQLDEYSVIKVKYNGKEYEQYVNQFTIDCKDNEALPNIGIDLADTLAVGQSFVDQVAERASSLIANPYTLGNAAGGGSGLSIPILDRRYINKQGEDRTPYLLSSDIGFEIGEFTSGASGGIFFRDTETGQTYIEADKLKIRMKAIFEELEIAKVSTIGGKFLITPGGGINISFVKELSDSYRCYFKAKEDDKGAECRFVVGDQVQCHEFNIQAGISHNASNRYYWRLVTAVNNDESYIELSKTDRDNAYDMPSDAPQVGDTIVQLGNRNENTRQSAIILSTVDAFAPCITLYNGIDHYSLEGKEVVEYGVDKTKNPPRPFFHCYGDMYVGNKDGSRYLKYTPEDGLIVKGSISSESSIVDDDGNETPIEDYINDTMQDKIEELQKQIDGVVETWNGVVDPTKTNAPASDWATELDKQAHIGDVYFNIGAYDPTDNPNAGHAWRWYYNSPTDYGWVEIADSDAVRALQLAQMSVLDTDVLYKQIDSRTDAPATPTVNTSGTITDLKGWSTDAPDWQDGKYIWQTTYVKKGDGSATFSNPTCISGRNGTDVTISAQSVKYSTDHGATQPADSTFTLNDVPTLSAGQYLWSMTTVTYSNGQSTKSYAVSRIGTNGQNGADGTSVTINSTSVTYAKTSSPAQPADTAFTYTSIGAVGLGAGDYLWTKTEVVYSDNSSTKSYTVSRIGSDGADGLPGTQGADGKTTYVHFAYASVITGTLPHPTSVGGFATTAFEDARYIGVCTDYNQADPTTNVASVYEWSEYKGNGIDHIEEEYYLSTSSSTPTGGSWKTEADKPTWEAGKYMWTRTHVYYTDGTDETFGEVCVTGAAGTSVLAQYSATGGSNASEWHPSYASGDQWMRTSSDGGQNWTPAIKIVGEDGQNGADGPWRKFQWAITTSSTKEPTSGWYDAPMTASAGQYVWMRSGLVIPPATDVASGGWGAATRITGDKGAKGDPGDPASPVYMLDLSNEVMGILCNSSGTVTGQYSTSQASVWKGSEKLTGGITYSIAQTDGVSATVTNAGVITPSALTKDNATIIVQAVVDGVTLQSTITLYKVKAGANGTNGAAAVVYSIEPSVDNITKSMDGTLSASSVTCSVYKTTGNSARALTSEKTLTYQRIANGAVDASGTLTHTSGTSAAVNILADTEAVIFELKDGTTILDRERIPIVANGNDLPTLADDIGTFDYIKEALKENTVINGGLVLSSLIKLGQGVTNGDMATMSTVRAGMNGLWSNDLAGRTIASWWGGDAVDRFNKQNQIISPVPANAANALVRMDGSAYFSQGNVGFNANGSGWLGHPTNGIYFGTDGSMTFASGIQIAGGSDTLQSILNFMVGIQNLFVPEDSKGAATNWNDIDNIARIKVVKGLYSLDFISARGANSSGGTSGGSGAFGLMRTWNNAHKDNVNTTDALGANLGWELKERIDNLPTTSVNPFALTIQKNGTALGTYDGSEAKTINISDVASAATLSSHTGNSTVHITSAERTKWNNTSSSLDAILGSDADNVINKYEEIVAFLATYTEADTLANLLSNKADKATTLAGYGITNAYTKTEADGRFLGINANAKSASKLATAQKLWGNDFDGTAPITGGLNFGTIAADSTRELLRATMASNDYFRLLVGGAANAGYAEIATGDDGTEPIHVRQYVGNFSILQRTLTLLDGSGYTLVPLRLGIGTTTPAYAVDVAGKIRASETIISTSAYGLRIVKSDTFDGVVHNHGFIVYNDGAASYFMLTDNGDPYGNFNSMRPLTINNTTGLVTMLRGLKVNKITIGDCDITYEGGGLRFSQGIYSDGFVSARGVSPTGGSGTSGGGGGLIQTVYGWDNLGGEFNNNTLNNTFNAYTINRIWDEAASKQWVEDKEYLTSHQPLDHINNSGDIAAISGTDTFASGLWLGRVYNNGYPTNYGNVLRVGGLGYSELFCGWTGASTPTVGDLYYRSKRDTPTVGWSDWVKLLTSGNTHISGGVITINGTSITPLTSHQSLTNYVTLNTAQTITGAKTFSNGIVAKEIQITGTGGATGSWITSDSADNLFFRANNQALLVLKATDNALRSGNSVAGTVSLGTSAVPWNNVYAKNFIRNGGTSAQFLKADGSVDGTAYLPLTGGTVTGNLYFGNANTGIYATNNKLVLKGGDGVDKLVIEANQVRRSTYTVSVNLGTADIRWATVYANTLNVTSTSVVSNLNADMLDGVHSSAFARADQSPDVDLNTVNGIGMMGNGTNAAATAERNYPIREAGCLIYCTAAYSSANQIYGTYSSNRWFARGGSSNSSTNLLKTAWREFAFLDSNVASADKLSDSASYKAWGQEFFVNGKPKGVSGLITADSGVQIGSTADIGWYSYQSRICAGLSAARGVSVGSLLVSSAWSDSSKVPTNGVYSKGGFVTESAYGLRIVKSDTFDGVVHNRGAIIYNDGAAMYFMVTENGDPYGNFNSLRPFMLHSATGKVIIGGSSGLSVLYGGYIGMGTDYPQYKLDVRGVIRSDTGIFSDGYVSARGQNTSDIRLKTDIRNFNATDIIRALRPVAFKWNAAAKSKFEIFRTDEVQYGLIAQEVKPVAPWLVNENMFNDGMWGVKYDKLIPVLLQGQREQIFRLDGLLVSVKSHADEIRGLKDEVRRLKARIAELEGK